MVDGREMETRVPETRNAVVIVALTSTWVGPLPLRAHYGIRKRTVNPVSDSHTAVTSLGTLSNLLGFRTLAAHSEKFCNKDRPAEFLGVSDNIYVPGGTAVMIFH